MMRKPVTAVLIMSSGILLQACYQEVNITLHKPGVYKGSNDPLLATLQSQDWQTKLEERFKLSQTDR
jgi:hypothetical protein